MSWFRKEKPAPAPVFPLEDYEPVIRCSICTGEQVACVRERATGKLHEVQLLRTQADLEDFCRTYQISEDQLRKIY